MRNDSLPGSVNGSITHTHTHTSVQIHCGLKYFIFRDRIKETPPNRQFCFDVNINSDAAAVLMI